MPKGPKGEKRPGDVIGAAIAVAKIATGEEAEQLDDEVHNDAWDRFESTVKRIVPVKGSKTKDTDRSKAD